MAAHLAASPDPAIAAGVARLAHGAVLAEIGDFFGLFPAVYALTATPAALRTVARAVLAHFLAPAADGCAECAYLELRTGPRAAPAMTRRAYLEAVLAEVERYPAGAAALIVSLAREVPPAEMGEVVQLAVALKREGRRVVGIDVCGDPFAGDVRSICGHIQAAKDAGLRVTLHIAEVGPPPWAHEPRSRVADGQEPCARDGRLPGHEARSTGPRDIPERRSPPASARGQHRSGALPEQQPAVRPSSIPTPTRSSLQACSCGTVKSLQDHHITWYLEHKHPVAICVCMLCSVVCMP
jgi:hypothetical protein